MGEESQTKARGTARFILASMVARLGGNVTLTARGVMSGRESIIVKSLIRRLSGKQIA